MDQIFPARSATHASQCPAVPFCLQEKDRQAKIRAEAAAAEAVAEEARKAVAAREAAVAVAQRTAATKAAREVEASLAEKLKMVRAWPVPSTRLPNQLLFYAPLLCLHRATPATPTTHTACDVRQPIYISEHSFMPAHMHWSTARRA